MSRGLVISDLHLFSRRSDGDGLWRQAGDKLAEANLLVLNGDIFDFRWSCLPDEEATIAAALDWIDDLHEHSRWDAIHYVFGNHDCLSAFKGRLEEYADGREGLHCHEFRLQLGRNLFLHGDCANRRMDDRALRRYRHGWSADKPKGSLRKAIYDGVDAVGISRRFTDLYFPQDRAVRRVAHHLDHVMPAWRDELDHCFFGHTHRPFANHTLEGVRFHNTGSGIRGMGFQPLTFDPGPVRYPVEPS